jgi:HD domain
MRPGDQQRIASLPLHAITTYYGEAGLRFRFTLEATRIDGVQDRVKVNEALAPASRLHAADRRQCEPYINHPLRVALRIMCHYNLLDADVISAALLHDTIEDHAADLSADGRVGALAELARQYGPRVAVLVSAVTNPEYWPGRDERQQYRAHLVRNLAKCPWARVIKVSDFTDDGTGLHYTTGAKAVELARKYAPVLPLLRTLIRWPDTPLDSAIKSYILGQLDAAEERFAAISRSTEGR